nr:chorismate mutase [Actinacidiphila yeochonensis]
MEARPAAAPAAASEAAAAPEQQGPATDPDSVIAEARQRIDAIDARIIELVQQRCAVSAEVQRARMGAGGPRVHLAREMEVLRTYGEALGRAGTPLAMTLLELGRGRI